jgi:hypothetical protein
MAFQDETIAALEQLDVEIAEENEELDDMTVCWGRYWCRHTGK